MGSVEPSLTIDMPRNSTNYVIAGTLTFRLGSRKILKKFGSNLQNVEKGMRAMYIPDEGMSFVQIDQSGAEALIVSYLCNDGKFRSLFNNNVKPHTFVALHLFKDAWKQGLDVQLPIDEMCELDIPSLPSHPRWKELNKLIKCSDDWPPSQRYYYIAKQTCHSANYGIRAGAFQMNVLEKSGGKIALSRKQAEEYLTYYHGLFPELREWHRDVEYQLKETQYLFNLFGDPRHFYYPTAYPNEHILKEAYAFIPQSTVGCITHNCIIALYNYIERENLRWDILANTHDSCLVQCPIGEEKECGRVISKFMNQELMSPSGVKFNMKSEAQFGFNWGPVKPLPRGETIDIEDPVVIEKYNLNGLRELDLAA